MTFDQIAINNISKVLLQEPKDLGNSYTWVLTNNNVKQQLFLSIHNDIDLGGNSSGAIISVQTQHGYFELHNCSGYLTLETEEVIFLNDERDFLTCLVIGSTGTCSLFSRVSKDLLNQDITTLDPTTLLAVMQLSLTEQLTH